ncbi:AAA family ATPase [Nitrincola iocasae]|uniref:AAA family ATPase n=1 Tax=Nitrincola iocasae TaxID=2614693 RepID=A0A5J6LG95_9GAMM|nr:AAA family ATPase [Nitrincola iocasae]QEW07619.1 AAA family ATPase [Nitrincola iocasae]
MSPNLKIENVIVYKRRPLLEDDNKGFLTPLLSVTEDGELQYIDKSDYPSDIFVSQAYQSIDKAYAEHEPFLLSVHFRDDEKTESVGEKRYWTDGKHAKSLPAGYLIPVVNTILPPAESSRLPSGLKAPKTPFFIKDGQQGSLFGLFMATDEGENGQLLEPRSSNALNYASHAVAKFDHNEVRDSLVELSINGVLKIFVSTLKHLSQHTYETYDYMSNSKLITYFNGMQAGKKNTFLSKREADKLKQGIAQFERQNLNIKGSPHLDRLKTVLDEYLAATDTGHQIVRDYFESSKGKIFLEDYVAKNKDALLSDQISKIEEDAKKQETEAKRRIEQIEAQIAKKQSELKTVGDEVTQARRDAEVTIQIIKEETEVTRRENLKELESELQAGIEKLEQQRDEIADDVASRLQTLQLVEQVEDLNTEIRVLEREITKRKGENEELNKARKSVEDTLKHSDLAAKVGEMAVVSRVLKGGSVTSNESSKFKPLQFASEKPSSATEVVDSVRSHLDEDYGKTFSDVEMANLLLSTTQSFLTVLAGPPGVGKTSSVVRLADGLQLGDSSNDKNFLYMPVARGWVSGRDILGFYNSLNNSYQRARTGLYDFLNNPVDETNDSLRLVLLDEANLSPMEHYWSDFIGMCDKEGRHRPIVTGRPEKGSDLLKVARNVRFVATINHDATTERLSPRLIDRVPIISLDNDDSSKNDFATGLKLNGALNYDLFEKYFTTEDAELSSVLEDKLNTIINLLGERDPALGQPVSISHRKVAAITEYFGAAMDGNLMDATTAFDFALSQHILPHIEGYGSKFRVRVEKLQSEIGSSYTRSSRHLERILASGNDMTGTYSFF